MKSNRGVSYIEFALSFMMLMMIAFFIVDGAVVLYHYHFLTDRTATFARRISAEVATKTTIGMSCETVAELARNELCALVQDPQIQRMGFQFDPIKLNKRANSPYAIISVNSHWPITCAACRFALPAGTTLRASSTLILEDDKSDLSTWPDECVAPGGVC